ncbi:hypothetical protein CW696_06600 [ANME-2 cluster archaeon]|nr:MAG: hypothetical protein CW696_06600 [ANME-2 cluster archaeon]
MVGYTLIIIPYDRMLEHRNRRDLKLGCARNSVADIRRHLEHIFMSQTISSGDRFISAGIDSSP